MQIQPLFHTFESKDKLAHEFANHVARLLSELVEHQGYATLAVSGGSTPKPFFNALRDKELPWSKITLMVVDERFVPINHEDSNEKLLREHLLHRDATVLSLAPLHNTETLEDAVARINSTTKIVCDIVILGMGEDGHTASLFPHHHNLKLGLESDACCIAVHDSPKPPLQRISMTQHAILQAKYLFLHITGDAKRSVYDKARQSQDVYAYPISAFIHQHNTPLITYWAA
jgi:6-phosphogluconolactonase